MLDSEILRLAREYLTGDCTVGEVAENNSISKKTLQNNFKKLKDIDSELYEAVETKKINNQIAGRKKGGYVGGEAVSYTADEANMIADAIINKQLTYKEAEEEFGKAHSTIYDMVLIYSHAYQYSLFKEIVKTKQYKTESDKKVIYLKIKINSIFIF